MKKFNNAFEILSEDPKQVENFTMRSDMMNAITDIIKAKKWTQTEAAKYLEVTQPRISSLKNGHISKFSIDMLMGMLGKLGFTFEFNYSPKRLVEMDLKMVVGKSELFSDC